MYKNGKKIARITLSIAGIYPTYLNLKKQCFFCKTCNASFIAKTSIVEDNCFISDNTKTKAFIKSAEAQSLTDIAKDCYVSSTTVQRIINKEAKRLNHNIVLYLSIYPLMNSSMLKVKWLP